RPSVRPVTVLVEMTCDAPAEGANTAEARTSSTNKRRIEPPVVVEEIRSEGYGHVASAGGVLGRVRAGLHHPDEESTVVAELLREQGERVQAPGQVEVAGEREHRLPHPGPVSRAQRERVEAGGETPAPRVAPKVIRARLHGAVLHAELPGQDPAGRDQEQRRPARPVQR